ncbi:MAG: methyltransferase, partial [Firmicutes bacterium]|nr:methyltransferase [Bacillota bacterium]
MERIENTGFGNIKLIQDPEQFCYGVDAVILADFANSLYPAFKKAADLGTGNGIIPLILSHKNSDAHITGVEIQPDAADMAMRSCRLNGLEEKMNFVVADVIDIADGKLGESINDPALCEGAMDMVTCNPPYFVKGGAIPS